MKINTCESDKKKEKMVLKFEDHFRNRQVLHNYCKSQLLIGVSVLFFLIIFAFILSMFAIVRVKQLERELNNLKYTVNNGKYIKNEIFHSIAEFVKNELKSETNNLNVNIALLIEPVVIEDSNEMLDILLKNINTTNINIQNNNETYNIFLYRKEKQLRKKRNIIRSNADGEPITSDPNIVKKHTSSRKTLPKAELLPIEPVGHPNSGSSHSGSYTVHPNSFKGPFITTPASDNKSSRTMNNDTPSRSFRHAFKKLALKSGDMETTSNEMSGSSKFTIIRQRNSNLEVLDGSNPRIGKIKHLLAIHYSGDTSKYVLGQHRNFFGNGHLRHPQQTFIDWKPKEWVQSLGMDSYYSMKNGEVTIGETGLYYIYAQIYYLDEHDLLGYWVQKNGEMILQCTITLQSTSRKTKGNTCFTAGVEYLSDGDTVSIADITEGKFSLFESGKSFFGLIKLSDGRVR